MTGLGKGLTGPVHLIFREDEMATQRPRKPANVPPPDKRPRPKPVTEWTPEEFLETLEEDQDDRRNTDY
jgi:hypothetical protein